jgi:hypothetical protein
MRRSASTIRSNKSLQLASLQRHTTHGVSSAHRSESLAVVPISEPVLLFLPLLVFGWIRFRSSIYGSVMIDHTWIAASQSR